MRRTNSNLKLNIPLVVKYIDDVGMLDREPRYFCDLQSGVFAYILICPTGDGVIGFSLGENNGKCFGWQMFMPGFQLATKTRNCGWADTWSEWMDLSTAFRSIVTTTVECAANSDCYLAPPQNHGNYIPVIARPISTWDTVPFIILNSGSYFLHAYGSSKQNYEVVWIIA